MQGDVVRSRAARMVLRSRNVQHLRALRSRGAAYRSTGVGRQEMGTGWH